ELIVRHYAYEGHAFQIYGTTASDISFENVVIYGCPGMGYFIQSPRGFRLSHCTIMQKPGTQRPVSVTADGVHLSFTLGDILIEDCDFSGQGDDALNIHANYFVVAQIVDSRTAVLTLRAPVPHLISSGSLLKFVKPNNLAESARLHVSQVSYDGSGGS